MKDRKLYAGKDKTDEVFQSSILTNSRFHYDALNMAKKLYFD